MKYCINSQAVCDANRKFIAISASNCGSTNDAVAFETSNIKNLCTSQQFPYHWVGDAAYVLNEKMVVPYSGNNLSKVEDSFNFFQSQVRINIECSFGILVARWGILWRPLRFNLENSAKIIVCCATLHNFCIDQRLELPDATHKTPKVDINGRLLDDRYRINYDVTQPRINLINDNNSVERIISGSSVRDYISEEIQTYNYYHNR